MIMIWNSTIETVSGILLWFINWLLFHDPYLNIWPLMQSEKKEPRHCSAWGEYTVVFDEQLFEHKQQQVRIKPICSWCIQITLLQFFCEAAGFG